MALSLVDFSHNAHIESMEKIWIDDECGAHLLTDSEIYAWKNKFTDEEHKMARHPNRSDRWMPQRVRKEINSWVRGRLTCMCVELIISIHLEMQGCMNKTAQ